MRELDLTERNLYSRWMGVTEPLRTKLKTNNSIERYIEEIRRRIIPMRTFNNTKSAERWTSPEKTDTQLS